MTMPIEAVSYMRCSGLSQVNGDTFDRQSETIAAACQTLDLQICHEYREEGVPGKYDENQRPAFEQMISDLLESDCKTIVVERLQRFAREYAVQERLAMYVASKGLTLYAADTEENITAGLLGDPMKKALIQIQGVFSELDKNLTVDKLAKARKRIRQHGRKPGARNYSTDPARNHHSDGRLQYGWKPDEAETLARIEQLATSAAPPSLRQIADTLAAENRLTRYGKPWQAATLGRIVKRARQAQLSRQTFCAESSPSVVQAAQIVV